MKILLTGANGLIGREIRARANRPITALDRRQLDIADPIAVERCFTDLQPQLVVNCAAFTAVDLAEEQSEQAFRVNHHGVANLGRWCQAADVPILHFSSDYVFSGTSEEPYREGDAARPIGLYGQSKLAGDDCLQALCRKHLILRISWVFGGEGMNFPRALLTMAQTKKVLRAVDDQRGCPTAAADVAEVVLELAERLERGPLPWGLYHYAGGPATSRYDFARAVLELARPYGCEAEVVRAASSDFPSAARRPGNSSLDCAKMERELGIAAPSWRPRLAEVVAAFYA